jgi:magnesium-transporting ATPase (P-type)
LKSFFPEYNVDVTWDKKRTIFEKLFAVDSDVRNSHLRKHSETTKRDLEWIPEANNAPDDQGLEGFETSDEIEQPHAAGYYTIMVQPQHDTEQRTLIIEGAALSHLMGTSVQDELLFSVTSCFDSVIACHVRTKQKALLVRTVRTFVEPEPITLAIGDGANDVGMIQEAHVGIGISGLEGQRAVVSKKILLINGRYNFIQWNDPIP